MWNVLTVSLTMLKKRLFPWNSRVSWTNYRIYVTNPLLRQTFNDLNNLEMQTFSLHLSRNFREELFALSMQLHERMRITLKFHFEKLPACGAQSPFRRINSNAFGSLKCLANSNRTWNWISSWSKFGVFLVTGCIKMILWNVLNILPYEAHLCYLDCHECKSSLIF